ncbi:MAG: DUF3842 family protein [Vallitaleaceae bacterium]|jgi:hypothetical protein|nr:DUF3842 family protein [Vallitaleaceae bacterium]
MKIGIVDGQGGGIGRTIVEKLRKSAVITEVIALGTNSTATMSMLKAGASAGATGENAIVVNAKKMDIIVGPMAILVANAMMGEITPKIAEAIGDSRAIKLLIPVNRCGLMIPGLPELKLNDWIDYTVNEILNRCQEG